MISEKASFKLEAQETLHDAIRPIEEDKKSELS